MRTAALLQHATAVLVVASCGVSVRVPKEMRPLFSGTRAAECPSVKQSRAHAAQVRQPPSTHFE